MPAAKPKKTESLGEAFEALKKIYKALKTNFNVAEDSNVCYMLESKAPMYKGKPMCIGAVRKGKSYVSFHLMALYCFPEMKKSISPELKRRMQGKQCFNFVETDPSLFAELTELAAEGARRFREIKDFEAHVRNQKCD